MATRPRVTSSRRQPTTGRGRIVRRPANPFVSRGTLAGMTRPAAPRAPAPAAVSAGGVPASSVQPAPYSLTNLPVDANYDQTIALLQRQRDQQLATITAERARTLSDYGFQESANGMLTFDPNNPFSKSSVMKKTYDTNRRSTAQSMGSGGQLYAGSFQNAQDLIGRNQLQSEDALQKNLQAFLARNAGQRAEAGTGYETAAAQAYGDRIGRFQSNPLYDPASGADGTTSSTPPANAVPAAAGGRAPVTKVTRGYVWQQNSNGTWRKLRPVNAFGH
jgi:hypothetical protein